MPKFSIRASKTVYSTIMYIEAKTSTEAANLGLGALLQGDPNWTDQIKNHTVVDVDTWRHDGHSRKKRRVTIGGRPRAQWS
jgi:hypothetical protein